MDQLTFTLRASSKNSVRKINLETPKLKYNIIIVKLEAQLLMIIILIAKKNLLYMIKTSSIIHTLIKN